MKPEKKLSFCTSEIIKSPLKPIGALLPYPLPGTRAFSGNIDTLLKQPIRNPDVKQTRKFMLGKPYSDPRLVKFKDGWYVEYYFDVPPELWEQTRKKRGRFKVYEDVNRKKGYEKEQYAADLLEQVKIILESGYSPYQAKVDKLYFDNRQKQYAIENNDGQPFYSLIDLYLGQKIQDGLSEKAVESYTTPINHFKKWLAKKDWMKRQVKLFSEDDMRLFLSESAISRNWSGTTYNNVRLYVFMWFSWMKTHKHIDVNPLTESLSKRISEPAAHESYHGRNRIEIKKILEGYPGINRFCQIIYFTCTRPKEETRHIRLKDIDLEKRTIVIVDGKEGKRYVPISDEMYNILVNEMKINECPLDFYLCSYNCMPGPKIVSKNYFANMFYNIKLKHGIGKNYTVYGWKHTRVNDLLSAGYSDAEVMQLTGHLKTDSYDKYKRNIGQHLQSRIKGKTVDF